MIFSSLPPYEGLHPIIVHFPIVLIIFAPFLLLVGITLRQNLKIWALVAGITLTCGALGAFAALETGEATAEYIDRTEPIKKLIEAHADIASQMLYTFIALDVVFWILYFGSGFIFRIVPRAVRSITFAIYAIIYLFGLTLLLQTAHLGGALVHQHGVHAPMGAISNGDTAVKDD